jgi:hypothetical protein
MSEPPRTASMLVSLSLAAMISELESLHTAAQDLDEDNQRTIYCWILQAVTALQKVSIMDFSRVTCGTPNERGEGKVIAGRPAGPPKKN